MRLNISQIAASSAEGIKQLFNTNIPAAEVLTDYETKSSWCETEAGPNKNVVRASFQT